MKKFSPVSVLFASIVVLVLSCNPDPAFSQNRGKGSHGGGSHGGSHSGGSRGSGHGHASGGKFHGGGRSHGGSHSGGFHGSSHGNGRSHSSGGGRSSRGNGGLRAGSGSHGAGGGHSVGQHPRIGAPSAPPQRGSGSPGTAPAFGHPAGPPSSRAFGSFGSANGNGQWHSFGGRGNPSFTTTRGPSTSSGDGQWHSFGSRGNSSFTTTRGPSTSPGDGQWHSFGSRGNSSVAAAREPSSSWKGGATRSWNGQGHQTSANNFGSSKFSRSVAPRWASNRRITAPNRSFTQPSSRTTGSAISTSRVLSNIDHTRFGNSATNRFSFSNSRFGSHTSRFERPEFGGRHEFRGGESNFGFERESSFGGDAFSFFPDLLGLALAFGSFGARGFGLPGLGFPGFGLLGLGLNLLESGFGGNGGYGDYGGGSGGDGGYGGYAFERSYGGPAAYGACVGSIWTPAPISPFRGPALIPYPAQILACPQ